jgi:hypothetical protein
MVFRPERDVSFGPLHSSLWLDALSQDIFSLELLPLRLRVDGHATSKDHVDLIKLIVIVRISLAMFSSSWLMCCWLVWHLLAIQKTSTLFQIMPRLCDGSRTTSWHRQVIGTVFFLSTWWVAASNSCDLLH